MAGRGTVFISHTSDMAAFPRDRSFVQAAVEAVLRAEARPVDMAQFAARGQPPAEYCQQQVRKREGADRSAGQVRRGPAGTVP
ncbi:hypothetical protein Franean1_3456 [Parafrankia sp. EAN1pec]|nr:hypothetical protein Franean1_3456 [Frankia sp. EAN1pec]